MQFKYVIFNINRLSYQVNNKIKFQYSLQIIHINLREFIFTIKSSKINKNSLIKISFNLKSIISINKIKNHFQKKSKLFNNNNKKRSIRTKLTLYNKINNNIKQMKEKIFKFQKTFKHIIIQMNNSWRKFLQV